MKKTLLGALLAAVALFLWGFLYWSVLPIAQTVMLTAPDEDALGAAILEQIPETGVYVLPSDTSDQERLAERHQRGPLATLFIRREGTPLMGPGVLLSGFLHGLICVLLLAWLLRKVLPALHGYGARVGFVVAVGIVASVLCYFGNPVWWYHPWGYYVVYSLYQVTSCLVVGLILGKFVTAD